ESRSCITASDDFQLGAVSRCGNPSGQLRATEASVRPDLLRRAAAEDGFEQGLCAETLWSICRGDEQIDQVSQSIDTEKSLAPLGFLGGVITDAATVGVRAHRLAVDDNC